MNNPVSYKRHRFPAQIIAHAVWLYCRFPLSLRLVEKMLLERGIVVSYETITRWGKKFGPDYAKRFAASRQAEPAFGIWMRWSSALPAKSIGYGGPSIRPACAR